jgi:hypothetical protein
MRPIFLLAAVMLSLAGCQVLQDKQQQFATISQQDTAQAVAIAKSVNDQPGVTCFTGFNQLATAAGAPISMAASTPSSVSSPATVGIATKIELGRGVRQVIMNDCGGLSGDFLINVIHGLAGPFAGLVP